MRTHALVTKKAAQKAKAMKAEAKAKAKAQAKAEEAKKAKKARVEVDPWWGDFASPSEYSD